ncbi:N-acetylmuramoyl-L-alanine amidase [Bacillus sp. ISL-39]|nr:N-acetylmuramoyl-L-alanine amidase [Bacillus sp. ISL-39]
MDWSEVAYPLIIGKNGVIYWTMDLNKVSYHVGLHNRYTFGICMIGDF